MVVYRNLVTLVELPSIPLQPPFTRIHCSISLSIAISDAYIIQQTSLEKPIAQALCEKISDQEYSKLYYKENSYS